MDNKDGVWNSGQEEPPKASDNYTHEEALKFIERFMMDAGIRKFCSDICKGHCCGGCYEGPHACHRNEGRRICCSIFLCMDLKNVIFDEKEHKLWTNMQDQMYNHMKPWHGEYKSPYYDAPKKDLKKCTIPKKLLEPMMKFSPTHISNQLWHATNLIGKTRYNFARDLRKEILGKR
jgi:hypothetical protein